MSKQPSMRRESGTPRFLPCRGASADSDQRHGVRHLGERHASISQVEVASRQLALPGVRLDELCHRSRSAVHRTNAGLNADGRLIVYWRLISSQMSSIVRTGLPRPDRVLAKCRVFQHCVHGTDSGVTSPELFLAGRKRVIVRLRFRILHITAVSAAL